MTVSPSSPLMTVSEAMAYLRLSRDALDEERRRGNLSFIQAKKGGKIFFRQQDLDMWISRAVHTARPAEPQRLTYRRPRAGR